MQRAFNCGIGMVLAIAPENTDKVLAGLKDSGEQAALIGTLKD